MSSGVAGHGALVAIEVHGASAGTFTTIAEQTGEQAIEFQRAMSEITPHNDTIDSHVPGVKRRAPVTIQGNLIYDNGQHDHLTGLQKLWDTGAKFGIRWRGPSGADNTDEILGSCHVARFRRTAPAGEGVYGFEAELQFSGPMEIDGVAVGTVG